MKVVGRTWFLRATAFGLAVALCSCGSAEGLGQRPPSGPTTIGTFTENNDPELFVAAATGSTVRLKELVEGGADVEALDERGQTPLMGAAGVHDSTLKQLLDYGADYNARRDDGWSALMLAYHRKSPSAVAALIAAGADTIVPSGTADFNGRDLCEVATRDAYLEMVAAACM